MFFEFNVFLFLQIAGLIIGLGAVTVIDWLGFVSRKSKKWTNATIYAHYVTKPLIWVGTIFIVISMYFLYDASKIDNIRLALLFLMLVNGSFLSFYVSPRLIKLRDKMVLLPFELQIKITISMIISFISWWTFVLLSVIKIG